MYGGGCIHEDGWSTYCFKRKVDWEGGGLETIYRKMEGDEQWRRWVEKNTQEVGVKN